MALVGDVIISARELIPDMPQVLPAPSAAPTAAVVAVGGSTLAAGVYFLVCSFRTPWGETTPSAEAGPFTVGANQGIQITAPLLPPNASVLRVYLTVPGGGSGNEIQFVESPTVPFTISTPPPSTGLPATRNSAFLPDTDGLRKFSAGTLYRWLNKGLARLTRNVGGIQDYSGVASVSGQPLYTVVGQWKKLTGLWYDGYPLGFGNQSNFFRRNVIQSSVLASGAMSIVRDIQVMEIYYQPLRTAGSTTLSAPMGSLDGNASVTSTGGFLALGPPMFALIDNEIVGFYALSAAQLTGLIRGVGGTTPATHAINAPVQELNIVLLGKRLFTQTFQPGNAANLLPVPLGWEAVLPEYILNMAKKSEQTPQEAAALLKEFDDSCLELLRANRQLLGPTQVGMGSLGAETVPGFGTPMGGVVLP